MPTVRYSLNYKRYMRNIILCGVVVGAVFLVIANVFVEADSQAVESSVGSISRSTSSGAIAMRLAAVEPRQEAKASYVALPETMKNTNVLAGVIQRVQQRQDSGLIFRDVEDIQRARVKDYIFVPTNPELVTSQLSFLTEKQKTDGRNFIQYDMRTLESRVEGDTVTILLSEIGLNVKAVIDNVESVNGMLRWSGHIMDFQEGGKFSITHAIRDQYAIGNFETPLGNFSLESKNGLGWIVNHATDFFLPPNGNDALHGTNAVPTGGKF